MPTPSPQAPLDEATAGDLLSGGSTAAASSTLALGAWKTITTDKIRYASDRALTRFRDNDGNTADITYVASWSGFAYVAFVTDVYSRRISGWNVAATLKADILPLQALDMAAW